MSKISAHVTALWSGAKHLYRKRMTLRYPESKLNLPLGYRYPASGYKGRHVLNMERCIGDAICELACRNITGAIKMVRAEGTFPRNRRLNFPQLDYGLCIFCGFCVDACAFGALTMSSDYELSAYEKGTLTYTPRMLASPPTNGGNARFVVAKSQAYHERA